MSNIENESGFLLFLFLAYLHSTIHIYVFACVRECVCSYIERGPDVMVQNLLLSTGHHKKYSKGMYEHKFRGEMQSVEIKGKRNPVIGC